MIKSLKKLFETQPEESPEQLRRRLNLAAAALLVETMRADFGEDQRERDSIVTLLEQNLDLPRSEVEALVSDAEARAGEATSLYEFTHLINQHLSHERRLMLIQAMWRVAYADGNLDKYEEALIRQVAELIYVPHADYIRAKLNAAEGKAEGK